MAARPRSGARVRLLRRPATPPEAAAMACPSAPPPVCATTAGGDPSLRPDSRRWRACCHNHRTCDARWGGRRLDTAAAPAAPPLGGVTSSRGERWAGGCRGETPTPESWPPPHRSPLAPSFAAPAAGGAGAGGTKGADGAPRALPTRRTTPWAPPRGCGSGGGDAPTAARARGLVPPEWRAGVTPPRRGGATNPHRLHSAGILLPPQNS